MRSEPDLRRELQRIQAPDELDAQRRAWSLARAAFETREPQSWERRHRGALLLAAAAVVVVAAVISPPGRALVGSVHDAVTDESPPPKPALTSLPAPGPLLVNSKNGPWIVQLDGSKRRLAGWWQGAWSPNAEFAVVTRQRELAAVDPDGGVRWSIARTGSVRGARWSSEVNPRDTRIAYLNRRTLRLVGGNGKGDRELRKAVGATAPAWRPDAFELAFSTVDGRIELVDAETGKTVWRTVPGEVPTQLAWSEDGQRLLALGERSLRVLDATGKKLWSIGLPVGPSGVVFVRDSHRFVMVRYSPATGRSDLVLLQAESDPGEARFLYSAPGDFGSLAMSPNGNWLLVGWVNADQWLFLRLTAARVQAVSNISQQFGVSTAGKPIAKAFPTSVSWCCPASP
jgi:PQQ-like domain